MQRYKRFRHMQEKKQKISPIKQRILHFVDTLGITKRDFYAKTGISRGTLESATGITEDTITKVFATYPSLSPSWLVVGVGEMLNNQDHDEKNCNPSCNLNCNLSNDKQNLEEENSNAVNRKQYLPFQSADTYSQPSIVAEPRMEYTRKRTPLDNSPVQQQTGYNDIIMNLVDRLNEQAEEIGALRQENSALKDRLAQLVEDVGNVKDVPA